MEAMLIHPHGHKSWPVLQFRKRLLSLRHPPTASKKPFAAQGFWVDFEAEGPAQVAMRFESDEERAKQLAEVTEICGNTRLSQHYLSLARDLDVMEAKLPEEVLTGSIGLTDAACREALL